MLIKDFQKPGFFNHSEMLKTALLIQQNGLNSQRLEELEERYRMKQLEAKLTHKKTKEWTPGTEA